MQLLQHTPLNIRNATSVNDNNVNKFLTKLQQSENTTCKLFKNNVTDELALRIIICAGSDEQPVCKLVIFNVFYFF